MQKCQERYKYDNERRVRETFVFNPNGYVLDDNPPLQSTIGNTVEALSKQR